jgi:hypothetical protein
MYNENVSVQSVIVRVVGAVSTLTGEGEGRDTFKSSWEKSPKEVVIFALDRLR